MGNNASHRDESTLRELYLEEDMTQEEVAEELGVSSSTIGNWLDRHGIEKDLTDPRKDEERLRELYREQGLSIGEIADELDTYRDVVHRWMVDLEIERRECPPEAEYPWQDAETLEQLYWEEGMTQPEIAEKFGTNQKMISKWMNRLEVEVRPRDERARRSVGVDRAFFYTKSSGYEVAGARIGGETPNIFIHKLVAIAECGFDEVDGKVVHHENRIPWDNRPENLRPMTDSEHKSLHRSEEYDPHKVGSVL